MAVSSEHLQVLHQTCFASALGGAERPASTPAATLSWYVSNTGGSLFQVNGNRIRIATANTPASAAATGAQGEISWDADYIYVCTATDTCSPSGLPFLLGNHHG
jgi:hypothetical protein